MYDIARYESVPVDELRDRVMDDLVKQYSLERLELDEFERRSSLVAKATSRGEMVAQLADLPDLPSESPGPARGTAKTRGPAAWSISSGSVRQSDVSVAIFSGSDLKGQWRAPRHLASLSIFGGTNIDLRRAIVPADGITISCLCAFGGTDIIVPPGMRVMTRGVGIFGGFDRTDNEVDDPAAPTVVVEGLAVFGGVSVKVRA